MSMKTVNRHFKRHIADWVTSLEALFNIIFRVVIKVSSNLSEICSEGVERCKVDMRGLCKEKLYVCIAVVQ